MIGATSSRVKVTKEVVLFLAWEREGERELECSPPLSLHKLDEPICFELFLFLSIYWQNIQAYMGTRGCCVGWRPKRFLHVTRWDENLSSGEKRAVKGRGRRVK